MKELLGSLELNRAYQMDCLEGMKLIPDKSIDMILCDLPYGTTACKWDTIIPFEPLWEQYERIIKDNGAIVLTASQPFTSALIMSNIDMFQYEIIWEKDKASNFMNAKSRVMKYHENVLIFYKKQPTYNPQKVCVGKPTNQTGKKWRQGVNSQVYGSNGLHESGATKPSNYRHPKSILKFNTPKHNDRKNGGCLHPTQKPVDLFEWLIKSYTNEGEIVLDNCLGSGTTSVACELNNRQWIGFETEREYIEVINKRLEQIELDSDIYNL